VNVEDVMSNAKSELSYSSKPLNARLEFSGAHSIQTAVKSAFCLAVSKGVQPKQCETACSFLLNYEDDDCFAYCNDQDILKNRPSDEMPLHCVAVSNISNRRLLLGYVEYFGIFWMIIVLSNNYSGDAIHGIYSIDPRTGTTLDLEFELDFTPDDIANVFQGKHVSDQNFLDHANCVIGAQLQKDYAAAEEKAIVNALKQAFTKLGVEEGGYLNPARANEFTDIFLEEFGLYIEHIVGGNND
jgi:hypothetical protein